MPSHWQFYISRYNATAFADAVAAKRTCIHLWSDYNGTEAGKINNGSFSEPQGFAHFIQDNVHIAHDTEYIDVSEAMEDHCDSNQCFTEFKSTVLVKPCSSENDSLFILPASVTL